MSASFEEFKKVCKRNCSKCSENTCVYANEKTELDKIIDNYIEKKRYSKCDCYIDEYERCRGTKELDVTNCGGNMFKCPYYDNVRKKAETNYIYRPQPAPEPSPLYQGYLTPAELQQAISNYKKQKVKKYYLDIEGHGTVYHTECPTCHGLVGLRNENFCAHCGQHLDWGEEE